MTARHDAQRDLFLTHCTSPDDRTLRPRRFVLVRYTDLSGISGEGHVADGVMWPDGTASVRWRGEHPSVVFWDRGRISVDHVHGHGGATKVRWLDDETGTPQPAAADGAGSLALRRAVDVALGKPAACPMCGRLVPCRCVASRNEARLDAVVAAVERWYLRERSEQDGTES
ncbi:hypothetical protein [Streptomyces chumphonensis]|uniref:hypothetical protein n=1 Tax=Streptomyces chumphonensis TaxID=1214925 RepID=UPI003D707E2F